MKTYGNAKFVDCPGMAGPNGKYEHSMRDNCWTCAPYWERVPTCPVDGTKLRHTTAPWKYETPVGYCRGCRRHYTLNDTAKPPAYDACETCDVEVAEGVPS